MPSPPPASIKIEVSTSTLQDELLLGLETWSELGLLELGAGKIRVEAQVPEQGQLDLTLLMTTGNPDLFLTGLRYWLEVGLLDEAKISVRVAVEPSHPAFLEGLEHWVQLQLLPDQQVKLLCREHLSSVLPVVSSVKPAIAPSRVEPQPRRETPSPAPRLPARRSSSPPMVARRSSESTQWVSGVVQSLMAELSVLWLLLLGIFMVVVSSGVLAASQWARFPAAGQYGVLWLYTLGFWGASGWAGMQPNLRLTRQALRIITLLLVPVNFLAMDSFGLWKTPVDWLVAAIACLSLTLITRQLFGFSVLGLTPPAATSSRSPVPLINHLGLSYVHWGWALPGFPAMATYLGIVGTVALNLQRSPASPANSESDSGTRSLPFSLNGAVGVYAVAILLLRAIFIAQISVPQLSLAIALCGWLLVWRSAQGVQPDRDQNSARLTQSWELAGGTLVGLGWLLSVVTIPWQAFVISGLGIGLLIQRLGRTWKQDDLAAALLIGLQMVWLAWSMVPPFLQQGAIAWGTALTHSQSTPWALLSVALFPTVWGLLAIADLLARLRRWELARLSGGMAFTIGAILTGLSLVNPALRTVNLALSTLTLGLVTNWLRSPSKAALTANSDALTNSATLTHIGGIFTLGCAVHWLLPQWGFGSWALLCLGLMILEWGWSLRSPSEQTDSDRPPALWELLQISAIPMGWFLSGTAYLLLLVNTLGQMAQVSLVGQIPVTPGSGAALWLITPLAVTLTGFWAPSERPVSSQVSTVALGLAQLLTLGLPETRSLGLAVATGLMLLNTKFSPTLGQAAWSVGYGLALAGVTLWQTQSFTLAGWGLAIAVATLGLWVGRHGLTLRSSDLAGVYRRAMDGWAIALTGGSWSLLLLSAVTHLGSPDVVRVPITAACGILMLGMAYRSWQRSSQPTATWASVTLLLLAQVPVLLFPTSRLLTLGLAIALMGIHTRTLRQLNAARITVGFVLSFAASLLLSGFWPALLPETWLLVGAIAISLLWITRFGLLRQDSPLGQLYGQATDEWAIALVGVELMGLTGHSIGVYWTWLAGSIWAILSAGITLIAIAGRNWQSPNNWAIYGIGWSLELLTIEVLGFTGRSWIALAIANTALGLTTQLLGDWWHRRTGQRQMLNSWHILPLVYGALGTALRWNVFGSWTGLSSLGLVLIALGVGRRQPAFKPLIYVAVAGISISAYELLFYQIQALGRGDQLLAMAALATTFVYAYRILTPGLIVYLRLGRAAWKAIAHTHWLFGSMFLLGALFYPVQVNALVGLGAGAFLTRYAVFQGRHPTDSAAGEAWVYLGMAEGAGLAAYAVSTLPLPHTPLFAPWAGAIAALAAVAVQYLPWQTWGWSPRPWRNTASWLPLGVVFISRIAPIPPNHALSVLAVSGFYQFLARFQAQPRWTYLTVFLVDWQLGQWLADWDRLTPFAIAALLGLSLLSLTWFEPECHPPEAKDLRHAIRLTGTGLIALAALIVHHQTGILPAILGIVGIFLGLGLRIRAFLYVGTATFLAISFYQLVILIFAYPLIKWMVGLILGISFIWIAASFETRREQLSALLRHWLTDLDAWE